MNIQTERPKLNRIKVVLAETGHTGKWLAEQLGKDPVTVPKWCTNSVQPGVETLFAIAKCLDVQVQDLLNNSVTAYNC